MYIYILIALVLGLVIGYLFERWRSPRVRSADDPAPSAQSAAKEAHKEALLAELAKNERLTNSEAQALLGVSEATVTRYFDELEAEGKVTQKGETGQGVYYTRR